MFALTTADWNLIEDFLEYTLPDVLRKTPGPARFPTRRKDKDGIKEPELTTYTQTFARVVNSTFGKAKAVAATIFTEPDAHQLTVRMVTFHLDAADRVAMVIESMESDGLLDQLARFHSGQLKRKTRDATGSGLGFQRVAYFFHRNHKDGVMSLTLVKPDECRYWTRSMAMRDADELAEAIARVASRTPTKA